jgi:hypothetical protein
MEEMQDHTLCKRNVELLRVTAASTINVYGTDELVVAPQRREDSWLKHNTFYNFHIFAPLGSEA